MDRFEAKKTDAGWLVLDNKTGHVVCTCKTKREAERMLFKLSVVEY